MNERITRNSQRRFLLTCEMVWGLRSDVGGKQWREPFQAEAEITEDGQDLIAYTIKFANDNSILT